MARITVSVSIEPEQLVNETTEDDLSLILEQIDEDFLRAWCSDNYTWVNEDDEDDDEEKEEKDEK